VSSKMKMDKTLSAIIKQLWNLLYKIYVDNRGTVALVILVVVALIFMIVRWINLELVYTLLVGLLFLMLSLCLYVRGKRVLDSLFSFSLGVFAAFAVNWNTSSFFIFLVLFFILVPFLFLISSIKVASSVEDILTKASSFYIHDKISKNKKELQEVREEVIKRKRVGLLSHIDMLNALLFFAFRKVPKSYMIVLIKELDLIYSVTSLDQRIIMETLSKVYYISGKNLKELNLNIKVLKGFIIESESEPSYLLEVLNNNIHFAIEKRIDFEELCKQISSFLHLGYGKKRINTELINLTAIVNN